MTKNYIDLVQTILVQGVEQSSRNGMQLIIPHYSFTLDFGEPTTDPKLRLRKMWYNGVEGEFKTIIDSKPLTNVSQFKENGCNYWDAWADTDGSINIDYANQMQPQLERLIKDIKNTPESRRLMIDLWVPENVYNNKLSLPCCWHNLTFSVIGAKLHMKWTQRSVDTMVGLPADIYIAYLFMEHIASKCSLKLGSCLFSLSNVHIYSEHKRNAAILVQRYIRYTLDGTDFSSKSLKFELKA